MNGIYVCFSDPQFIFSDADALVTVDGSQFRVTVVESSDPGDSSAGDAVHGFSGPSSDVNVVADAGKKV